MIQACSALSDEQLDAESHYARHDIHVIEVLPALPSK
jgi:hypothetical protein